MYHPLPKSLTIHESQIEGLGLFAKENIPSGTDLGITHIYDERFPDNYIRLPLGGFFNHSNEPNCQVIHIDEPYKHIRLQTIKDINIGDELTAFYTLYVPEPIEKTPEFELRGYGIIPYNIKPIQAGIQYSHAIVEYVLEYFHTMAFQKWGKKFKTAILLDGGTSNHTTNRYSDDEYVGSMEMHLKALQDNNITLSTFYEPDLNDMLAGIFLIVDERVFNKKKYPDFGWKYNTLDDKLEKEDWFVADMKPTQEWINSIGGEKNFFLRNYLIKLPLWR